MRLPLMEHGLEEPRSCRHPVGSSQSCSSLDYLRAQDTQRRVREGELPADREHSGGGTVLAEVRAQVQRKVHSRQEMRGGEDRPWVLASAPGQLVRCQPAQGSARAASSCFQVARLD